MPRLHCGHKASSEAELMETVSSISARRFVALSHKASSEAELMETPDAITIPPRSRCHKASSEAELMETLK